MTFHDLTNPHLTTWNRASCEFRLPHFQSAQSRTVYCDAQIHRVTEWSAPVHMRRYCVWLSESEVLHLSHLNIRGAAHGNVISLNLPLNSRVPRVRHTIWWNYGVAQRWTRLGSLNYYTHSPSLLLPVTLLNVHQPIPTPPVTVNSNQVNIIMTTSVSVWNWTDR